MHTELIRLATCPFCSEGLGDPVDLRYDRNPFVALFEVKIIFRRWLNNTSQAQMLGQQYPAETPSLDSHSQRHLMLGATLVRSQ